MSLVVTHRGTEGNKEADVVVKETPITTLMARPKFKKMQVILF